MGWKSKWKNKRVLSKWITGLVDPIVMTVCTSIIWRSLCEHFTMEYVQLILKLKRNFISISQF